MKPFVKFRLGRASFSDRADWTVKITEASGEFKDKVGGRFCAIVPQSALDGRYCAQSRYLSEDFSFHTMMPTNTEDEAEDEMRLSLEYNLSSDYKEAPYEPRTLDALIDASYLEECGFPKEDYEVTASVPIIIINSFQEVGEDEISKE